MIMAKIHPNVEYVMISEQEIKDRIKSMAQELDKVYEGKKPIVICILKGSSIFFADLIRQMQTTMAVDFMSVSSYGSGTVSSGELKIRTDLSMDIAGRDVLIVEDIIDSGNTLYRLKNLLGERNPASLNIVTLLDKPARREAPIKPDYTCFVIEDEFVIGYGLDYDEEYRNLPYVGVLKRSVYENA
jgi:hypoxanthine phosphoribosyltransferase